MTGASGFVGRHLIPLLVQEQNDVVGLARHSPDHTGSAGTIARFDFIPGDVRDRAAADSLLEGCQALVHLAASFDPDDDASDINERGAETVMAAAKDAGIDRVVYLSCLGAHAAAASPFYSSKWRAEMMVKASGIPFTILLPSLVVGNGDGFIRPLADLIQALPVVPVPGPLHPRLQPIDVADLCRCIVIALAADSMKDEMVSIGGSVFLTLSELVDLISGELGVAKPKLDLPAGMLAGVTRLLPRSSRLLFSEPRLAQLRQGVVASPGIVPRMFGFQPASVVAGLRAYLA